MKSVPCVIIVKNNIVHEHILCNDSEHQEKVFRDKLQEYLSNYGDYSEGDISEIIMDGYEKFGNGSICISDAMAED